VGLIARLIAPLIAPLIEHPITHPIAAKPPITPSHLPGSGSAGPKKGLPLGG
jgi:hypothetical protein